MAIFWGITALTLILCVALMIRAARGAQDVSNAPSDYDLKVYRDQLKEVERDVARGVLAEADAERVRIEVSRRILAADAASGGGAELRDRSGPYALAGIAVAVFAGSYGLYLSLGAPGYGDLGLSHRIEMAETLRADRPSQAEAETGLPPLPVEDANAEYQALVQQLRGALAERPNDVRGLRLLAQAEARLGNFTAGHKAQARLIELTGGEDADPQEWSNYAELMILAAGGYISPEAEQVLVQVLDRDGRNPTARFYWGQMLLQTGRPDQAFRIWDGLLRESTSDAPWVPPIMSQIREVAAMAGVPNYQPPTLTEVRGPSAADIEAAEDMTPTERMQMIEGMVSGLAQELSEQGGPPQKWAQLISALGVMGRLGEADAIFQNAKEVFENDPGAMDIVNRAADRVGLQ